MAKLKELLHITVNHLAKVRKIIVTSMELLAIIDFHHYLKKFLIRTDHGALGWVLKCKYPEGQVARCMSLIFNIGQVLGIVMLMDGLSRRPCTECSHC